MKWALKNIGLTALGLCLLCASVEANATYSAYLAHENGREENLHKAYSNVLNKAANVATVSAVLPRTALAPPITFQEIPITSGKGKK